MEWYCNLRVGYMDLNGSRYENVQSIKFKGDREYYDNLSIREAIAVSDFVTIIKNWLIDSRASCNDRVKGFIDTVVAVIERSSKFPPKRDIYRSVEGWERKSCKLVVSDGYRELFKLFRDHLMREMKILNGDPLKIELKILDRLIKEQ